MSYMNTHTVTRKVLAGLAPDHETFRTVVYEIEAWTPGQASRIADDLKYEDEERLNHHRRSPARPNLCC